MDQTEHESVRYFFCYPVAGQTGLATGDKSTLSAPEIISTARHSLLTRGRTALGSSGVAPLAHKEMSGNNPNARRLAAPKGTMTRGANSGPAIMLLPPGLRACFMPGPPLGAERVVPKRRKHPYTGLAAYMKLLEESAAQPPKARVAQPTPQSLKEERRKRKLEQHKKALEPLIEEYRKQQRDCGGEFQGMNCYNTLFVGRLAYEVSDRKLLRELEQFGPVKDVRIVRARDKKAAAAAADADAADMQKKVQQQQAPAQPPRSKYAFVEYEHEEDMKRAYRAADGMRLEGRDVVVDVERGHTVPTWLPRRLGGGLGGTRLGGKDVNVTRPGRYDPKRPAGPSVGASTTMSSGRGGMPPPPQDPYHAAPYHAPPPLPHAPPTQAPYGYPPYNPPPYESRGGGDRYGYGGGGPPPPRGGSDWRGEYDDRGRDGRDGYGSRSSGGGSSHHKRPRSNSPDRRHGSSSSRHRSSRY
jgi:U1 small nuclear ribonucleoprotein 70kDa